MCRVGVAHVAPLPVGCCKLNSALLFIYSVYCLHMNDEFIFLDYIVQLRQSQRAHTHTPMNTRAQTLSLSL